jgi:hypothetical protein
VHRLVHRDDQNADAARSHERIEICEHVLLKDL